MLNNFYLEILANIPSEANVTRAKRHHSQWPLALRNCPVGELTLPWQHSAGGFAIGYLEKREEAEYTPALKVYIENLLVQEWLAEKRKTAQVQWHWV